MEFLSISLQAISARVPKMWSQNAQSTSFWSLRSKDAIYFASWIPVFYSSRKKKKDVTPFWPSKSSWAVYECQGHPWLCRWSKEKAPRSRKIVKPGMSHQVQRPASYPVTHSQHGPTSKPASFLSPTCWTASPFTTRLQAAQELEAPALKDIHPHPNFSLCRGI